MIKNIKNSLKFVENHFLKLLNSSNIILKTMRLFWI